MTSDTAPESAREPIAADATTTTAVVTVTPTASVEGVASSPQQTALSQEGAVATGSEPAPEETGCAGIIATLPGHVILFFTQILYAVYAVLAKETFRFVPVEVVLSTRFTSGVLQMVLLAAVHPSCAEVNTKSFMEVWETKWKFMQALLLGVLAMVVNVYLYLLGIKYTDAVTASAFQCTTAGFSMIVAAVLGREQLTVLKGLAILLAISGDILVLKVWTVAARDITYTYGILCLVGNVSSFAVFIVLVKPFYLMLPTFYVLKYLFLVGLVGCTILSVTASPPSGWLTLGQPMSPTSAAGIVFATVCMGALPYVMNGAAFYFKMSSAITSLYAAYQPLLAALLSFILRGSVVDDVQGGGIALVVCAVLLGGFAQQREIWLKEQEEKDRIRREAEERGVLEDGTSPPISAVAAPPAESVDEGEGTSR